MLDLVPECIDGVCVLNLKKSGSNCDPRYCDCGGLAVSVHNLMIQSELRYVVIDMQDEKEICDAFVEQMIQLWKRTAVPFYFAGVMPRFKAILDSYGYLNQYQIYGSAIDVVEQLCAEKAKFINIKLDGITFGTKLPIPRSRQSQSEPGTGDSDSEETNDE